MSVSIAATAELPPSRVAGKALVIHPVFSSADIDAFVRFPFRLFEKDPHWVPPLVLERKDFLNPRKNPWFEHGTAELFVARRGGEVVGRIAAVDDPHYNAFHGTHVGFYGMFDCIDDVSVARALFDAAAARAKARGFSTMLGPVGFSTNYECSVLVDGFDESPVVLMAYNPRYYPGLYDACGFTKAKDMWTWNLDASIAPPEKVVRIAEKVRKREGLVIRAARMADFEEEARRIKDIYNAAWERNWGFVPMSEREFDQLARDLRPVIVPDLVLIAEVRGDPVAFSITLPDTNVALKVAHGRLARFGLPWGLARLMVASRGIKRLRLVTLGIKEKYRKRGIDAVLYLETLQAAHRLGYASGEIGWTLENNDLVNRAIQMMGGTRGKTYRMYERAL